MKGWRTIVVVLAVALLGMGSPASALLIDDFTCNQGPDTTLNFSDLCTTELPGRFPSREILTGGSGAVGEVRGGVYSHSHGAGTDGSSSVIYHLVGPFDVTADGYVSLLVDVVSAEGVFLTVVLTDSDNINATLFTDLTAGPGTYAFSFADFLTSVPDFDLTQIERIEIRVDGGPAGGTLTIGSIELAQGFPKGIPELTASVEALDLPRGTENSLLKKLTGAQKNVDDDDLAGACDKLASFINEVNSQSGKKIEVNDADALTDDAEAVRAALGCS